MKVSVDLGRCQGYACCLMEAPAVFDIDEETSKAVLLREDPPEEMRTEVETAVRSCPSRAISLEG